MIYGGIVLFVFSRFIDILEVVSFLVCFLGIIRLEWFYILVLIF